MATLSGAPHPLRIFKGVGPAAGRQSITQSTRPTNLRVAVSGLWPLAKLRHLMKGRTTLVIAHRLATIRSADQILVIESGRIAERGNHATLYVAGGRYHQPFKRQHRLDASLPAAEDGSLEKDEGDLSFTGPPA